jgi:hypothetical protein
MKGEDTVCQIIPGAPEKAGRPVPAARGKKRKEAIKNTKIS